MTSDVSIRPATADDLPACAKIINDWIDETNWMPRIHTRAEIGNFFSNTKLNERHFLVGQLGQKVVGYLSMDFEKIIQGFYIAQSSRQGGLGKLLLDKAKTLSPELLQLWTFQKNIGAQRFYKREGFREVRRTQGNNEEKLPDILYQWKPSVVAA